MVVYGVIFSIYGRSPNTKYCPCNLPRYRIPPAYLVGLAPILHHLSHSTTTPSCTRAREPPPDLPGGPSDALQLIRARSVAQWPGTQFLSLGRIRCFVFTRASGSPQLRAEGPVSITISPPTE